MADPLIDKAKDNAPSMQTDSKRVSSSSAENWPRSQAKAEIEQCWARAPWCSEGPMVNSMV